MYAACGGEPIVPYEYAGKSRAVYSATRTGVASERDLWGSDSDLKIT